MVVPCLRHHLEGDKQPHSQCDTGHGQCCLMALGRVSLAFFGKAFPVADSLGIAHQPVYKCPESGHTHADPDGEGIE